MYIHMYMFCAMHVLVWLCVQMCACVCVRGVARILKKKGSMQNPNLPTPCSITTPTRPLSIPTCLRTYIAVFFITNLNYS